VGEKAPWLVTLILGVLGWLLSHTVDRIISSPTVEYDIRQYQGGDRRGVIVHLRNITRDKSFDHVQATVTFPDGKNFKWGMVAAAPASEGDEPPVHQGATVSFAMPLLMPGTKVGFAASATGTAEPVVRIWSAASQPVRLQRRGAETFFARHETGVMTGLIALWLVALLIILVLARRASKAAAGGPGP
jgi:hypothetical protein